MVDGLATMIIIAGLALAGASGLMALLNRPPQLVQLLALALVELLLLVQAVTAIVRLVTGDRPDQAATFVGYLLTAVLIPPLGAMLGWSERTRWGSAVIAGAGLVVVVLVLRLQQVWNA